MIHKPLPRFTRFCIERSRDDDRHHLPARRLHDLDCTNVLAGPFACYQLASPATPARACIAFLATDAGKESMGIDLKQTRGREGFERIVLRADAVVENFRPGVMR